MLLVVFLTTAQAAHSIPAFSFESTSNGAIWCKFVSRSKGYVPIRVKAGKNPTKRAVTWQSIIRAQKKFIKSKIANLNTKLAAASDSESKSILQKKLNDQNLLIIQIDHVNKWKFDACAAASNRILHPNLDSATPTVSPIQTIAPVLTVSPTPTFSPIPTEYPDVNQNVLILIKQHARKIVTLQDSNGSRIELLSNVVSQLGVSNLQNWGCNTESGNLQCDLSNGSFIGDIETEVATNQYFSDRINDHQKTIFHITIRAISDPTSFSGLEMPTSSQLIAQVKSDQGHGIRPWARAQEGLLAYAAAGDPVALSYRERLLNALTRVNGGSMILHSIPALNVLNENDYDFINLCRYLETPLLSQPVSWHVLNPDGTPLISAGSYVLKTYQPEEMRTLVRDYMVKIMTRYSQFSTWKDANAEIGRSMLAINFAYGYSCIRDEIDESNRSLFERALVDKYITPTLYLFNHPSWPVSDTGNQGIELASVFTIANAVLMKERPEESAQNILIALQSLSKFLNLLYRGGSLEEGPNYEVRSFDYLIKLDEALWRTFGTNFGLLSPQSAVSEESSLWQYNAYGPGGYIFGFNDVHANIGQINSSQQNPWNYGIGLYLADLFNDPQQALTDIGRLRADWPGDTEFLYYKPINEASVYSNTPKDYVSSGYPLFATRSAHSTDALYLAASGQVHGDIHNHKNPGTYVVHWKGVPFVDSLFIEGANINYGFDGTTNYWTQVGRRQDIMRNSTLGSNSLTLTNPLNLTYILTHGRPTGYASDSDPKITFTKSGSTASKGFAVLDMTRSFIDFNNYDYISSSQQNWPLPAGRFVVQSLRGYALDRANPALPWAYVCDDSQYTGTATSKIAFNTPASVTSLGSNQYQLSYTQPTNSSGGTRVVSMKLYLQSLQTLSVSIESLNDLPSNPSRYPSWWPWSTLGFQCNIDSSQSNCFHPTHLPNMSRFNVTTTGTTAQVCMIFVPEAGVSFTPPSIPAVSTW